MPNNYGVLACVLWGKQHPLVLMIRLSNCSKQKRFQTLPSVPEAGEQHQWQEGSVLHGKQALKDSARGMGPLQQRSRKIQAQGRTSWSHQKARFKMIEV